MSGRAALVVTLLASGLARGEEAPLVQVIVDSSESSGRFVIGDVVQAVAKGLGKTGPATVRLAGGKEGKCGGSPMLLRAGEDVERLEKAKKRLVSQGNRNLAEAINRSSAEWHATPGVQRMLVVVTAGTDTCGRNVCDEVEASRKLQAFGTARVVYTGDDDAVAERLRCLGEVKKAANLDELVRAVAGATDAVRRTAELTAHAVVRGQVLPATLEVYAPGDEQPSVRGAAGQVITLPSTTWDVRVASGVGADGRAREGWKRAVPLPPASKTTLKIELSAEPAKLDVAVRVNGKPAPQGTQIMVFAAGQDDSPLETGWPDEPLSLDPGIYDVRAEVYTSALGPMQIWSEGVRLVAGETKKLALDAVQKLAPITVQVTSGNAVLEGATAAILPNGVRGQSDWPITPGEPVNVPPGTYTLYAAFDTPCGTLERYVDNVKVAGSAVDRTLDVGATGTILVGVEGARENESIGVQLSRLLDSQPGFIDAEAEVRVAAGRYDVKVQLLDSVIPIIRYVMGVEVRPGEATKVKVRLR